MLNSLGRRFYPWCRHKRRRPVPFRRSSLPPRLEVLEDRVVPAIINVNSTADVPLSQLAAGQVTLRDAIQIANTNGATSNTINLTVAGTYQLSLQGFVVNSVTINNAGSGYTSAPTVTFSAPSEPGGITATGTATVAGGVVTGVTITNRGSGYVTAPTITFSGGGGSGASAAATLTPETDNSFGEFAILPISGETLTINNVSGGTATINGNNLARVFDINPNLAAAPASSVIFNSAATNNPILIENGNANGASNALGNSGGAVRIQGLVNVTSNDTTIANSTALGNGGGIAGAAGNQLIGESVALLPGSLARGKNIANGVTTDERGFPRATPPDVGAFQILTAAGPQSVTATVSGPDLNPNPVSASATILVQAPSDPVSPTPIGSVQFFAFGLGPVGIYDLFGVDNAGQVWAQQATLLGPISPPVLVNTFLQLPLVFINESMFALVKSSTGTLYFVQMVNILNPYVENALLAFGGSL
jgi:hypothetical protein